MEESSERLPGGGPVAGEPGVRALASLAAFNGLYLAASIALAWKGGNLEFAFYIGVVVLLIAAIWAVHRRIGLSLATLWALSLWGLAHMAGGLLGVPDSWPVNGEQRVLYSLWLIPERLKYDHVVHAYGFGVSTWICWQGLRAIARSLAGRVPAPTVGLLSIAALAGLGLGALNEVVEFAATRLVPETNVGGYENTGWDLVANSVGALTAAILIRVLERRY